MRMAWRTGALVLAAGLVSTVWFVAARSDHPAGLARGARPPAGEGGAAAVEKRPGGEGGAVAAESDPDAATAAWREGREQELRGPDGWLAVSGLFMLEPGPNTAGSDPANAIVLPEGAAPPRAATFVYEQGSVTVEAHAEGLTLNGEPFSGRRRLREASRSPDRPADRVGIGRLVLHLHRSGDRLALRLRDPQSPIRTGFRGLRWFAVDPQWRVTGRFLPYDEPRPVVIQNILGDLEHYTSPGEVEFAVGDRTLRLVPVTSGQRLWFIFSDATAGTETYPIRFLYADAPQDGRVVLDFNRAYNPPCAYNPYTTCPLPPPSNRLPVAVPAGERIYDLERATSITARLTGGTP
jgi:uncharacterized protein (DUF1684 family)